jgi:hypothetical protein
MYILFIAPGAGGTGKLIQKVTHNTNIRVLVPVLCVPNYPAVSRHTKVLSEALRKNSWRYFEIA